MLQVTRTCSTAYIMRIIFVIHVLILIHIHCVSVEGRISVTRHGQKEVLITEGHIRGLAVALYPSSGYLPPVEVFRGIQYHITRGKTLRFFPPRPFYETWNTRKPMSTFSKACFQRKPKVTDSLSDKIKTRMSMLKHFTKEITEDCLYLNVYVPISGKLKIYTTNKVCHDALWV